MVSSHTAHELLRRLTTQTAPPDDHRRQAPDPYVESQLSANSPTYEPDHTKANPKFAAKLLHTKWLWPNSQFSLDSLNLLRPPAAAPGLPILLPPNPAHPSNPAVVTTARGLPGLQTRISCTTAPGTRCADPSRRLRTFSPAIPGPWTPLQLPRDQPSDPVPDPCPSCCSTAQASSLGPCPPRALSSSQYRLSAASGSGLDSRFGPAACLGLIWKASEAQRH